MRQAKAPAKLGVRVHHRPVVARRAGNRESNRTAVVGADETRVTAARLNLGVFDTQINGVAKKFRDVLHCRALIVRRGRARGGGPWKASPASAARAPGRKAW